MLIFVMFEFKLTRLGEAIVRRPITYFENNITLVKRNKLSILRLVNKVKSVLRKMITFN